MRMTNNKSKLIKKFNMKVFQHFPKVINVCVTVHISTIPWFNSGVSSNRRLRLRLRLRRLRHRNRDMGPFNWLVGICRRYHASRGWPWINGFLHVPCRNSSAFHAAATPCIWWTATEFRRWLWFEQRADALERRIERKRKKKERRKRYKERRKRYKDRLVRPTLTNENICPPQAKSRKEWGTTALTSLQAGRQVDNRNQGEQPPPSKEWREYIFRTRWYVLVRNDYCHRYPSSSSSSSSPLSSIYNSSSSVWRMLNSSMRYKSVAQSRSCSRSVAHSRGDDDVLE